MLTLEGLLAQRQQLTDRPRCWSMPSSRRRRRRTAKAPRRSFCAGPSSKTSCTACGLATTSLTVGSRLSFPRAQRHPKKRVAGAPAREPGRVRLCPYGRRNGGFERPPHQPALQRRFASCGVGHGHLRVTLFRTGKRKALFVPVSFVVVPVLPVLPVVAMMAVAGAEAVV